MDYQFHSKLIEFVRLEGREALNNEKTVADFFSDKLSETQLCKLRLVLSCDAVKDFIENAEKTVGRTEVNNFIMTVVRNTGLKVWVVKDIISALLDSIDIIYDRNVFNEEDPVVESFQLSPNSSLISSKEEAELLDRAEELIGAGQTQEATEIYEELVNSGSTEAMYQLAMIYLGDKDAIFGRKKRLSDVQTTQVNRAMQLLQAAAEDGHTKARVEIGHYYYDYNRSPSGLKKAFSYYSAPGIPTTDTLVRDRLFSIYNQEKTNLILLILSGVLLISMWAFTFICQNTLHNGTGLIGLGIALSSLATLAYAFAFYCFIKYKYIYLKYDIGVMCLLWLIYPLVLSIF